jgi:hypothetical protein
LRDWQPHEVIRQSYRITKLKKDGCSKKYFLVPLLWANTPHQEGHPSGQGKAFGDFIRQAVSGLFLFFVKMVSHGVLPIVSIIDISTP